MSDDDGDHGVEQAQVLHQQEVGNDDRDLGIESDRDDDERDNHDEAGTSKL